MGVCFSGIRHSVAPLPSEFFLACRDIHEPQSQTVSDHSTEIRRAFEVGMASDTTVGSGSEFTSASHKCYESNLVGECLDDEAIYEAPQTLNTIFKWSPDIGINLSRDVRHVARPPAKIYTSESKYLGADIVCMFELAPSVLGTFRASYMRLWIIQQSSKTIYKRLFSLSGHIQSPEPSSAKAYIYEIDDLLMFGFVDEDDRFIEGTTVISPQAFVVYVEKRIRDIVGSWESVRAPQ